MRLPGRHLRSIERDLARLADGTLEPEERERVERSVAASHELQWRLRDQRRALAAVRGITGERAPLALRIRGRALTSGSRRGPRWPTFTFGLAGAIGALVWTLAAVGGGQAVLTVADAATISTRPAIATVPEPRDDTVALPGLRAAGLPFPYWDDAFGWRATGVRTDIVDSRTLTTVFYRSHGRRIAYTIVPGASLATATGAEKVRRDGIVLETYATGNRRVVTWLRRGHTCVLSGTDVPLEAMLRLAAWRSHGELPY